MAAWLVARGNRRSECLAKGMVMTMADNNRKSELSSEAAEKDFQETREEIVRNILEQQPDDEILYDLAELFKVFGDSTRIKILYSMFENELCVNDIAKLLHLSQSSVSHQLRILKSSKLVKFRREGKSIFYSLDDEHVRAIISMGMEHVEE